MKRYAIGDHSYKVVSEAIETINNNCDVDGEPRIPLKFFHQYNTSDNGWYIECLNEEDEPRLEKHLNFIYGFVEENYTGILSPDGSFIECENYEHLELAKEIAEKLNSEYSHKSRIVCKEYLQKLGYIIVRAHDVCGLIGYLDDNGKGIYLSAEQQKWLKDNYGKFPKDKQRSIDALIENSRWWHKETEKITKIFGGENEQINKCR